MSNIVSTVIDPKLQKLIELASTCCQPGDKAYFIPQAPYDNYTQGLIRIEKKDNNLRRYISLSKPINKLSQSKHAHSLARYTFQVYLWNKDKSIIPEDLHVDHINNDPIDDRIDNYQLLTAPQNTAKRLLLKGALIAIMICPVCLKHFEKPARMTQYADCRKDKKFISYCSTRCHYASEFTMAGHEKHRTLRNWISDNQIYKLIRVWTTGEIRLENIVSDKMLDFDLAKATEIPIEYGSAKFASPSERKVMIRDYRNQGMDFDEIARRMHLSRNTVWQLADEPIQKVHLDEEELKATLERIKHWRNKGYSQERIGCLLGIPRTSVSQYIRRHSEAWDIDNNTPASKGNSIVTLICPVCHNEFERPLELTQLIGSRSGRIMCCSDDCRWSFRISLNKVVDREKVRRWVSENQIIRVDKIIPSGIRFFDRDVEYDPEIKTFDISQHFASQTERL